MLSGRVTSSITGRRSSPTAAADSAAASFAERTPASTLNPACASASAACFPMPLEQPETTTTPERCTRYRTRESEYSLSPVSTSGAATAAARQPDHCIDYSLFLGIYTVIHSS